MGPQMNAEDADGVGAPGERVVRGRGEDWRMWLAHPGRRSLLKPQTHNVLPVHLRSSAAQKTAGTQMNAEDADGVGALGERVMWGRGGEWAV